MSLKTAEDNMPTVDYGLDDSLRSEYREGMRVDWDVPIHAGPDHPSHLLMPFVPSKE
jgi:hypothetical protein